MEASGRLLEDKTSEVWKIRRHRGGSEDKRVSSEVASLQRHSRGPPCSPPLCHIVDEDWVVSTGWLSSRGPLKGAGAMFVGYGLACIARRGPHIQSLKPQYE